MRKMQLKLGATGAVLALWLACVGCSPSTWAIADQPLRSSHVAAHPHLILSPIASEPGWEFGRHGPWVTDYRQTPDYPPFNVAVISAYERLSVTSGRPRDHAHWTTRARHGSSRP